MASKSKKLIKQFRELYDRRGEQDLQAQIPFLNDLAEMYYAKCRSDEDWMDGVKAHGLFNSCGARDTPGNKDDWLERANKVEKQCLQFDRPQQYKRIHIAHRDQLESIRSTIENKLNGLAYNFNSHHNQQIEEKFHSHMKSISLHCTEKMKDFTHQLLTDCIDMFGPPPCGLAVAGMGSLARGEMTPFSDLEYLFLIEREEDQQWFHKLALLTYFTIANLGETSIERLNIEQLKGWFNDMSRSGFQIDGFGVKAGNIPTGNGLPTGCVWMKTVNQMSEEIESMLHSPHLSDGKTCDNSDMINSLALIYCHGNGEKLFNDFISKVRNVKRNEKRMNATIEMLRSDIKKFNFLPEHSYHGDKTMDVKVNLYRYPSLIINDLKIMLKVDAQNVWETVDIIAHDLDWTDQMKHALKFSLASAIYLRMKTQFHHRSQNGLATVLQASPEVRAEHFCIPQDLFIVMSSYLYPFKKLFLETIKGLRSDEVKRPLKKLNISIDEQRGKALTFAYCMRYPECLDLMQGLNDKDCDDMWLCGTSALFSGSYDQAHGYFRDALRMEKEFHGAKAKTSNIAAIYHQLGIVSCKKGEYAKALDYCKESLKTYRAIRAAKSHIAVNYHELGFYTWNTGKYPKAYRYCKISLKKKLRIYGKNKNHTEIAATYHLLGIISNSMHKYDKALAYCQKSLDMHKNIHGESTIHPVIAANHQQLGVISRMMRNYDKAREHCQKSLEMNETYHRENTDHPDIADTHLELGVISREMDELDRALMHCKTSLDMYKKINEETAHRHEIADNHHELSIISEKMCEFDEACKYCKASLDMELQIHSRDTNHPHVVRRRGRFDRLNTHQRNTQSMQRSTSEEYIRRVHQGSTHTQRQ